MRDRRYTDDEAAAIFLKAAEGAESLPQGSGPAEGMTLAQLQEIGREVGLPASAVAAAARAVEREQTASPPRTILGLPLGVERSIDLPRKLTEPEWEHLVVRLRETFGARGQVRAHGSFREWTNGNLQALLEPTPEGQRLRLRTVKGSARSFLAGGLGTLGLTAVMVVMGLIDGHLASALPPTLFTGSIGLTMLGYATIPLPGWARLRARQMDAIAERLAAEMNPALPPPA